MNRPIKFRAWNLATRTMVDLHKITPFALNMDVSGLYIPFSGGLKLMQFTGLYDKNGKEIYESDCVRWKENAVGVVVCSPPAFKASVHGYRTLEPFITDLDVFELEVIGNIYENPELLNPPNREHKHQVTHTSAGYFCRDCGAISDDEGRAAGKRPT